MGGGYVIETTNPQKELLKQITIVFLVLPCGKATEEHAYLV